MPRLNYYQVIADCFTCVIAAVWLSYMSLPYDAIGLSVIVAFPGPSLCAERMFKLKFDLKNITQKFP